MFKILIHTVRQIPRPYRLDFLFATDLVHWDNKPFQNQS